MKDVKKADPKAHPESQDAYNSTYCTTHCTVHDPGLGCPYCNAADGSLAKPSGAAKAKRAKKTKSKAA